MPSLILSDNGVSSGSAGLKTIAASDGSLALQTTTAGGTATTAVTIDTSQNVGVGEATPAAYGGFVSKYAGIGLHANSTSGAAGLNFYEGGAGRFSLRTLNGSAGLSFYDSFNGSERARITAGGDLGVGTTSPTQHFEISGTSTQYISAISTNGANAGIRMNSSGNRDFGIFSDGSMRFYDFTASAERARITAGGAFGIGTQNPDQKLVVNGKLGFSYDANQSINNIGNTTDLLGIQYYANITSTGSAIAHQFGSGLGQSAVNITYGGDLLAGATSNFGFANPRVAVTHGIADYTLGVVNNHPSLPYGIIMRYSAVSPNSTGSAFIYADDSVGQRFSFRSNGGLYNYSGNDSNLSDRREKTNFAPAKSYLDVICSIPVQTFNYIDQNMEEDGGLTLGVVAQDVQAVAPELVMESNWASKEEEPKMRLSIYQTDMQYALMKCIQEQQALITSLTARLDAANL